MGKTNAARKDIRQRAAVAEGEHPDQPPFFEVSKKVESPDMLKGWVEWFKRLNIPCAVMKTRRGYVLLRKGEEVGRTRSQTSFPMTAKNIVYSFGIAALSGERP
jgi:hypothetical protein